MNKKTPEMIRNLSGPSSCAHSSVQSLKTTWIYFRGTLFHNILQQIRTQQKGRNNPALASTLSFCLTFVPNAKTIQPWPPEARLSRSMSHPWTKNTFITTEAHAAGSLTRSRVESDSYLPFGQTWMDAQRGGGRRSRRPLDTFEKMFTSPQFVLKWNL